MTDPFQNSSVHPPAARDASRTALVLGGGGSTGNAWLIGVIASLFEAGVDVTAADVTIGTSAGATAAAQLASSTPSELFAAALVVPSQRAGVPGSASTRPVDDHLTRMRSIIDASDDATDMRRRMGASALELDAASDDSWQPRWRATVASRLAGEHWPQRRVLITAVDAATGEPAVFERDGGVALVDAVAASCSSGRPYRIGDRLYIDGGFRSNAENADLAAGYERVLVLSPFGGRSLVPVRWGTHLATQVDELRARGSRVETVFPGSDAEHLFGAAAMDLSLRPSAAQAGHDLGRRLARQLADFGEVVR